MNLRPTMLKSTMALIAVLLLVTSCSSPGKSDEEIAAEQTLSAIYL